MENIFRIERPETLPIRDSFDEIVRAAKDAAAVFTPKPGDGALCGTFFQVCRITQYSRGKRACPVGALVVGDIGRRAIFHIIQFVAFKTIGKSKRCIFAKRIGNPDCIAKCVLGEVVPVIMRVIKIVANR